MTGRTIIYGVKDRFTCAILATGLCALMLAGCAVGPEFSRPDFSGLIPAAFKNKAEPDKDDPRRIKMARWWERLEDPALAGMTQDLLKDNLTLASASARVVQARERATIAGADLWPQVGGELSRLRSRTPLDSAPFGFGGGGPDAVHTTQLTTGVSASWQIDLFGKIRRSREAAKYSYLASVSDREALLHTLVSDLVRKRVTVATYIRRIELSERTIETREQTLEIVERRYEAGLDAVSALDVRRARESLNTAQSELPVLRGELQDVFYDIDILLGDPPGRNTAYARYEFAAVPPPRRLSVPPPVELLDRRPDLKSHELRLAAATAGIGVAMADFYPGLSLQGRYAYESAAFRDWIRPEKIAWSILSELTQRLFEGGRLRANLRLRKAEAEELAADYAQAVLKALKDVESALQREEKSRQRVARLEQTVTQARAAEDLASKRYERGLIGLLDLLDAQRRLFVAEEQLILAEQAIWEARTSLYLAMGGDWGVTGAQKDRVVNVVRTGKPVRQTAQENVQEDTNDQYKTQKTGQK